jgi:RHS repeat-associated protein
VVATSYTYEPFGRTTVSGTSSTNPFAFTGREEDSIGALSLYHYRARYYSPSLQRFLTEDPIGFYAGDPSLYSYSRNDPMNVLDPLGLKGGSGGRKDSDYNLFPDDQDCGIYSKVTIGFLVFAVSVYHDSCGFHVGGSLQASLLPVSGGISVGNGPISCSSLNVDAYYGPGAEVGAGEADWEATGYAEVGLGTPNVSGGLSGVWNCPNG